MHRMLCFFLSAGLLAFAPAQWPAIPGGLAAEFAVEGTNERTKEEPETVRLAWEACWRSAGMPVKTGAAAGAGEAAGAEEETTAPQEEMPHEVPLEEAQEALRQAVGRMEQPPAVILPEGMEAQEAEITLLNAYYAVLAETPEYKYAYALETEVEGDRAFCTLSYMPYRTGVYPEAFAGREVGSLRELVEAAESNLHEEELLICITDPELQVDDMQRALQQAGGGYFLCELNKDATAIQFKPHGGLEREECLQKLKEAETLAKEVLAQCQREGQTQEELARDLYSYLTENVKYDFRYYSEPEAMPMDSTTAYGALHDGLAICGGYAHALQTLFALAGIPCYTVSGVSGGEAHMWNIALVDGEWLYYDATRDRGCKPEYFSVCGVTADELRNGIFSYSWEEERIEPLLEDPWRF